MSRIALSSNVDARFEKVLELCEKYMDSHSKGLNDSKNTKCTVMQYIRDDLESGRNKQSEPGYLDGKVKADYKEMAVFLVITTIRRNMESFQDERHKSDAKIMYNNIIHSLLQRHRITKIMHDTLHYIVNNEE